MHSLACRMPTQYFSRSADDDQVLASAMATKADFIGDWSMRVWPEA